MLLYFSSNGQLKEVVNDYDLLDPTTDAVLASGFLTASGSINANFLFAIFEGENPTPLQVSVTYQMPGGGIYSNASIPATGTLSAYIKFDKGRDLTNFKAGKTYEFVKFSLNDVLAVGGEGYYRANFELYKNTPEARAFGTFEFTAQGSPSQLVKNEVTETQYQLILAEISSCLQKNTNPAFASGTNKAIYAQYKDSDGNLVEQMLVANKDTNFENNLAMYGGNGRLKVGNPTESDHAATKGYVDSNLEAKLDKYTGVFPTPNAVYAQDSNGNEKMLNTSKTNWTEGYLAMYDVGGTLNVGDPTANNHAATKAYVDSQDESIKDWVEGENYSSVSVSATGSSTTEAKYITVDGTEWKLGETPDLTDYATTDYVDEQDEALSSRIDALSQRGKYLSGYDCATGEADTVPPTEALVDGVYPYTTGDYFIVSNVGTGTKYIPSGEAYDPDDPEKQAYTGDLAVNDTLYYNGESWQVIHTQVPVIPIANESAAGLVKSTSSTVSGSVSVSDTGAMTVNGWATLVKLSQANGGQVFVKASSSATAASGIDYSEDADASSIAQRTSAGKLKAVTPTSSDDDYTVATKEYVDDAVSGIDLSGYVSKSSASSSQVFAKSPTAVFGLTYGSQNNASTLILRDSGGKAQITSPSSSDPDATIANKGYVNAQISASLGDIESALSAIIGHTE